MLAQKIIHSLKKKKFKIAVAESITGGLIANTITDIPGASQVFECGWVTYSNKSKNKILGVPLKTLQQYGAVSKETVASMALFAKTKSGADMALAITGFAGPDAPKKSDIGQVFIAIVAHKYLKTEEKKFKGNREEIRAQACYGALSLVEKTLLSSPQILSHPGRGRTRKGR